MSKLTESQHRTIAVSIVVSIFSFKLFDIVVYPLMIELFYSNDTIGFELFLCALIPFLFLMLILGLIFIINDFLEKLGII